MVRKAGLSSSRHLPSSLMESATGETIGRCALQAGTCVFVPSSSSRGANLKKAEIHRGAASSNEGH